MLELTRRIGVSIVPSVEEVAMCFCDMDADEMARFFSQIAVLTSHWQNPFCVQLAAVSRSDELDWHGRDIMQTIGHHAHYTE